MTDARLPQIPAYGGSVFVSYARADDEKPPFDDATHGWVTFFWNQLRFELTNAGVHQATLWLDRYQIEPTEDFTEKIEKALRAAQIIVPIVSPNWVQRPWCQREITYFCELRGKGVGDNDDIVLVVKTDTPPEAIPLPLRNREGYRFFGKDTVGKVREFYWRGLRDQQAYFDMLKRMADWIAKRLIATPLATARNQLFRTDRVIFVAASTDELRDARQRLVNDLRQAGYAVVPEDDRLPDTLDKTEENVREMLASAEMAIHPLAESEGVTPEGGVESITRLQLRLARAHAAANARFPRVLWAPKWLVSCPDNKRDPFEVVNRFGPNQSGEEVYAEDVTSLSQWLRIRLAGLREPSEPGSAPMEVLVAGAAEGDDELISSLANQLQGSGARVRPMFFGDAPPAPDSPVYTAVLMPWGTADRAALDRLLANLSSLSARTIVLRLPGGDEAAKRRFFVEGIYVEKLDALPTDRAAARALLAQLLGQTEKEDLE